MLEISLKKQYTEAEFQLVIKNLPKSFADVVNALEKFYGKDLEISVLFDKYFKHINTIEFK